MFAKIKHTDFCLFTFLQHRNFSILTGVLQHGLTMWKSAKRSWYDLFVVGMLKDYSLKKRFAIVFAKNYHKVMETLKQDSPNSPFTIASLSGSIFNVPSIAHYLIEHHQIFNTIVGTLLKELELAFNTNSITSGRLQGIYVITFSNNVRR